MFNLNRSTIKTLKNTKTLSFLSLLICAVIYASFGVFIRQLDKGFGDFFQITIRSIVTVGIFGAILLATKTNIKVKRKDLLKVTAFAISFPLVVVLFTLAVLNIKIANAVLLLYGGSLFSSLVIGTLVFKEKITKQKILALILVLIGLCIFTQVWLGITVGLGFVLGILSGIMDGITNSLRKYLKDLPRNTILFYQFSTSVILSLTIALVTHEKMITNWSILPVLTAIVFGILLVVLSRLMMYGFSHTDVNLATVTLASELLFSVILGYIFLKETPANYELIGGVIILSASVLSGLDFNKFGAKLKAK